jgi:23S rRNA (guanine2445-N2)-methyltransferase / 23S rRNA (guanine2069-N7)-methyltransferase
LVTYIDWARKNLELNGFVGPQHHLVRSDIEAFVTGLSARAQWDLAVVDPPTFSNTKGIERNWDVQRDHAILPQAWSTKASRIGPSGRASASTNSSFA